tara:strand:- start:213 stop:473 length:261 start_codon:yes stop_codon:yes gene_type:complete
MDMLKIKSNENFFFLKGKEILEMEIKLNITKYRNEWKEIGDYLYNFYNLIDDNDQPLNILEVNNFQYVFLKDLKSKSYEQLYKTVK